MQEVAQVYTFTDFSLPLPARGYQPRGRDEGLTLGQFPRGLLWAAPHARSRSKSGKKEVVLTKVQIVSGYWARRCLALLLLPPPRAEMRGQEVAFGKRPRWQNITHQQMPVESWVITHTHTPPAPATDRGKSA